MPSFAPRFHGLAQPGAVRGASFEGDALLIDRGGNGCFYGRRGASPYEIITNNGILIPAVAPEVAGSADGPDIRRRRPDRRRLSSSRGVLECVLSPARRASKGCCWCDGPGGRNHCRDSIFLTAAAAA